MVKTFDKVVLQKLRIDVNEALKSVAEKYNIVIEAGNASYAPENASFKLNLSVKDTDGEAVSKDGVYFKQYARLLGMKPEDLNREFEVAGKHYRLKGYNPRKSKFPFSAECLSDGKLYGFGETLVKTKLK